VYALTGSRRALFVAGCSSVLFLYRILSAVKRGPTAEFFIIVALAVWFARKKAIPRWIMIPGLIMGMLLSTFNIGEIRRPIMNGEFRLSDIQQIEWNQDLKNVLSGDAEFIVQAGGGELEAAAYYMDAIEKSGSYDWGTGYWNSLVNNTVPGQLFGDSFVRSLYVNVGRGWDATADPYAQFFYTRRTGLTTTGMTDSFGSFWYFGCIKFFVVAFIMSKLFLAANRGHRVAQILCMVLSVHSLHAITHSTFWFYKFWPHMVLFLLPALLYARVKQPAKPT